MTWPSSACCRHTPAVSGAICYDGLDLTRKDDTAFLRPVWTPRCDGGRGRDERMITLMTIAHRSSRPGFVASA